MPCYQWSMTANSILLQSAKPLDAVLISAPGVEYGVSKWETSSHRQISQESTSVLICPHGCHQMYISRLKMWRNRGPSLSPLITSTADTWLSRSLPDQD